MPNSAGRLTLPIPALATSTSTTPTSSISRATSALRVRSAMWEVTSNPSARSSPARSWMRAVVETTDTLNPACPSARATAKPIPPADPAPVTKAWRVIGKSFPCG